MTTFSIVWRAARVSTQPITRSAAWSGFLSVVSLRNSGRASQSRPQNRLTLFTSTSALFIPMSDREKGCRTQFVSLTVSASTTVTSRPPG